MTKTEQQTEKIASGLVIVRRTDFMGGIKPEDQLLLIRKTNESRYGFTGGLVESHLSWTYRMLLYAAKRHHIFNTGYDPTTKLLHREELTLSPEGESLAEAMLLLDYFEKKVGVRLIHFLQWLNCPPDVYFRNLSEWVDIAGIQIKHPGRSQFFTLGDLQSGKAGIELLPNVSIVVERLLSNRITQRPIQG